MDRARIEALVADGRLSSRDIDAIMVGAGYLSYDLVEDYLAAKEATADGSGAAAPREIPSTTISLLAEEITERICGCQVHDGGQTTLLSADRHEVEMEVGGACVHCPQILYTIDVLQRAIKFRDPSVTSVSVQGVRLHERVELPENRQYTLALFMKTFGLTFRDIDDALLRKGRLTDEDMHRLASVKQTLMAARHAAQPE
ncbi:MAG: NifU family protein [Candidatus Eremiobacteraeota bacterium]|nr:NifU family protein [Candidatus Eremiobacteraeota bacterium]